MAQKPNPPQIQYSDPINRGLVGAWLMAEGAGATLFDASGNRNDGALSGGVTWTAGPDGAAISFDGTTGRAELPLPAALQVQSHAWYARIRPRGDFGIIWSAFSATGWGVEWSFGGATSHQISMAFRNPSGIQGWYGAGPLLVSDQWNNVFACWQSGTLTVVVSGASETAITAAGPIVYTTAQTFDIGTRQGHDLFGAFDLSDLRIWSQIPASPYRTAAYLYGATYEEFRAAPLGPELLVSAGFSGISLGPAMASAGAAGFASSFGGGLIGVAGGSAAGSLSAQLESALAITTMTAAPAPFAAELTSGPGAAPAHAVAGALSASSGGQVALAAIAAPGSAGLLSAPIVARFDIVSAAALAGALTIDSAALLPAAAAIGAAGPLAGEMMRALATAAAAAKTGPLSVGGTQLVALANVAATGAAGTLQREIIAALTGAGADAVAAGVAADLAVGLVGAGGAGEAAGFATLRIALAGVVGQGAAVALAATGIVIVATPPPSHHRVMTPPRRRRAVASGRRRHVVAGFPPMPQAPDLTAFDAVIETGNVPFDFGPWYGDGVTITEVVSVTLVVVAGKGSDADPASRIIGAPTVSVSERTGLPLLQVNQRFGSFPGTATRYLATCVVRLSTGETPSLWVHIPVVTPA